MDVPLQRLAWCPAAGARDGDAVRRRGLLGDDPGRGHVHLRRAARGLHRRRRGRHRGGRGDRGRDAGHGHAAAAGVDRGRPALPVRDPRRRARHAAVRRPGGRPATRRLRRRWAQGLRVSTRSSRLGHLDSGVQVVEPGEAPAESVSRPAELAPATRPPKGGPDRSRISLEHPCIQLRVVP